MERGRRVVGVERVVAADRLAGRQRLDLDAAPAQLLERLRVGRHPAVGAGADDEPLGKLVEDGLEVVEHQPVAVLSPPVREDTAGKEDDVACLSTPSTTIRPKS
jgi:hypothetical protein